MKEEKIEELVEQKIEEKLDEKTEEKSEKKEEDKEDEQISRRGFLKKAGLGIAGIGALAMSPASALDLRSENFRFFNESSGGLQFEMESDGTLDLQGNQIKNSPSVGIQNPLTENLDLDGNNLVNSGTSVLEFGSAGSYSLKDMNGNNALSFYGDRITMSAGTLQLYGVTVEGRNYRVKTITSDTTVYTGDIIECDTSGGAITLTLNGPSSGEFRFIVNTGSNTLTIQDDYQNISGNSSITLNSQYQAVTLMAIGDASTGEWFIANSYNYP